MMPGIHGYIASYIAMYSGARIRPDRPGQTGMDRDKPAWTGTNQDRGEQIVFAGPNTNIIQIHKFDRIRLLIPNRIQKPSQKQTNIVCEDMILATYQCHVLSYIHSI